MGGNRGDTQVDSPFYDFYEAEQDSERQLGDIEISGPNDLILDENPTYAIALLK